jgi:dihydrofolate reductase
MPVTVFVGTSVDGFLAREDDGLDFLPTEGPGPEGGFEAFLASVDAIVMGRRTFEVVQRHAEWPYGAVPVFVLSRSRGFVASAHGVACEVLSGSPAEVVAALARRGFTKLYVDGGQTIRAFLAAGLVDRFVITQVPVLIGQGIPLFGPLPRDVRLRHVSTRALPGGLVQTTYDVVRGA